MTVRLKNHFEYEQLDLFDDGGMEDLYFNEPEEIWDGSRGRNYIKAHGRDGKDVTIVFDHLDRQYHLLEE